MEEDKRTCVSWSSEHYWMESLTAVDKLEMNTLVSAPVSFNQVSLSSAEAAAHESCLM